MNSTGKIYLTVLLFVKPGEMDDFLKYEEVALSRLKEYGGLLESRLQMQKTEGAPDEVHIISFPSNEAFQQFKEDPVRKEYAYLFTKSVEKTQLLFSDYIDGNFQKSNELESGYLLSALRQIRYYKGLGEKAMKQLNEGQLLKKPNEASNSIAITVNHLSGNMLSRWTDFLTSDGEKPWRNRDDEFEELIQTEDDLWKKWNEGWTCFLDTIQSLQPDDLNKLIYIRNEGHTVMEAINRQLCHYSYHIGQIVYIARMWKESEWVSLSIPKNKSKEFNQEKFDKPRQKRHFTDDEDRGK